MQFEFILVVNIIDRCHNFSSNDVNVVNYSKLYYTLYYEKVGTNDNNIVGRIVGTNSNKIVVRIVGTKTGTNTVPAVASQ